MNEYEEYDPLIVKLSCIDLTSLAEIGLGERFPRFQTGIPSRKFEIKSLSHKQVN